MIIIKIILLLILILQIKSYSQEEMNKLLHKNFNKKELIKVDLNYLLYLPEDYKLSDKKYPLVIFLHGSGERGDDLEKVKKHGIPKLIEDGKKFPFILIAPQCPSGKRWTHLLLELSLLIEEIQKNYLVDEKKIYLTGLSMGGQGTWALAFYNPQKFAAIAPICGWTDTFEACNLKDLPIWIFHGAKDEVISIEYSQKIYEAIKNCGSNKIKITIYPDLAHDSWTRTYNNPEFYNWLLSISKE
ncbi:MAG: dienelactone hydrolase family protein [Ignavibacterium sp.]|nr:dienelactone hydrolase family protein [Ignavibacterium sp.]MDW8374968.1 dienelactone hydrolase family protein [Ignavibacteriales bacterium]